MVVNYELTAADYREAAEHHQRSAIRRKLLVRVRGGSRAGLMVFAVVAPQYVLLRNVLPVMESPERAASPLARAVDMLLPLFAVCLLFAPIQAIAAGRRVVNWRTAGWAAMSLVFFAIAGVLAYLIATAQKGVRAEAQPLPAVLAPHLAWLLLVAAGALVTGRAQRLNTRVAWEGQQQLHLPFTLEASVEGLTLSTANGRHEYPWRGVTAFVETPNLFLVHVSDLAFQIVPKRAFPSDAERDAFRSMLQNLTPPAKPAFEVLPAAAVGGGQPTS